MFCASIIIAVLVAIFLTAWAALIVQSLASGGKLEPYFASELVCHFPPENDDVIDLDADFVFVDSNGEETVAPKGLESDGASVGSLLPIPIIGSMVVQLIKGTPLTGPLRPAAIPHDDRYARAEDTAFWPALISSQRAIADRIIYEAARCGTYKIQVAGNGVHLIGRKPLATWRAFIVMALLRIAGSKAWLDDSRASRSLSRKT